MLFLQEYENNLFLQCDKCRMMVWALLMVLPVPFICSICIHWHCITAVIGLDCVQVGLAVFLLHMHLLVSHSCSDWFKLHATWSGQPNPMQPVSGVAKNFY